jgi:hypothetical protein
VRSLASLKAVATPDSEGPDGECYHRLTGLTIHLHECQGLGDDFVSDVIAF